MPRKRTPKPHASPSARGDLAPIPAAEALSFLCDTRGLTTWSARDLAGTLKIDVADAKPVIAILELQGYVKPSGVNEWMTTMAGEEVSGSKPPRFTHERIQQALDDLRRRIAGSNRDTDTRYKITQAVAFGDFLADRARVQAATVGIQLEPKKSGTKGENSAEERRAFLRRLKGKGGVLQVRPYEKWMSKRTSLSLL